MQIIRNRNLAFHLFVNPVKAIPQLVARDSFYLLVAINILFGVVLQLDYASQIHMGESIPLVNILLICFFYGAVIGIGYWMLLSFVIYLFARIYGSERQWNEISKVVGWMNTIFSIKIIFWLMKLIILGRYAFVSDISPIQNDLLLTIVFVGITLLELAVFVLYVINVFRGIRHTLQISYFKTFVIVLAFISIVVILQTAVSFLFYIVI